MSYDQTGIFGILGIKDSRDIGVKYKDKLTRLARINKLGRIIGYRLKRDSATIELIGEDGVIEIDAKTFTPWVSSAMLRVGLGKDGKYKKNPPREEDIVYEGKHFYAIKVGKKYEIRKHAGTHSWVVGTKPDKASAIRCASRLERYPDNVKNNPASTDRMISEYNKLLRIPHQDKTRAQVKKMSALNKRIRSAYKKRGRKNPRQTARRRLAKRYRRNCGCMRKNYRRSR